MEPICFAFSVILARYDVKNGIKKGRWELLSIVANVVDGERLSAEIQTRTPTSTTTQQTTTYPSPTNDASPFLIINLVRPSTVSTVFDTVDV